MAIRQSVFALQGAISDGLAALRQSRLAPEQVDDLRTAAWELTNLTGSAGERGWYGELFRYFNDHPSEGATEPVAPPTYAEIHADLEAADQELAPTWAARAIAAAYVLDWISDLGVGPANDMPRFLIPTLAASPAEDDGFMETGKVGLANAEELAGRLNGKRPNNQRDFWGNMRSMSGTLATSVASLAMTAGLRKVKREYCSVTTTTAEWPTISYDKLKSVIEPDNWSSFYQQFFCEMKVVGVDAQGWTRIREAVSGECPRYRLRTALKFWKAERGDGLYLNYDMDPKRECTDDLVLVDNGYIWIKPLDPTKPSMGVRVRTSKQLLISGMSATALTKLAESLGYATNATDMFLYAAAYSGKGAHAFKATKPMQPATPDTSTAWEVRVPRLPASLRDEMCRDTTEFIKDRLEAANELTGDFAEDWEDGIDLDEFNEFADNVGEEVTKAAKDGFELATENFRPKAPAPPGP